MKRVIIVVMTVLLTAALAAAQTQSGQTAKPAPNAPQKPGAQPSQPAAPAQPAQPQMGKPQPQPKSQDEFKAFNEAFSKNDPAGLEAAANDFATKFPNSDVRILLYLKAMGLYQNTNDAEKTIDMGHKVLAIDPKTPEALVTVATVISERTRETDLDRDQRLAEATKDAQEAIADADMLMVPPNTDPQRVDAAKKSLVSLAYSALGTVDMIKKDYPSAEQNLKKSVDANAGPADPVTFLRLAVVLDQQKRYPEALAMANKAVESSPADSQVGNLSKQERDRLAKLAGAPTPTPAPGATTAPGMAPQPKPQTPPPTGQQTPPPTH